MKKSTRKIVNRLKPLIGTPIIRNYPTCTGHPAWTEFPAILCGFTPEGGLIVRNIREISGNNYVHELSLDFTDYHWTSLKKAKKSGHSPLNKWQGKKIRRIVPATLWQENENTNCTKDDRICILQQNNKDTSFMEGDCILIHASKHHVFLRCLDGREFIADFRYANPDDWELAE